MYKSLSKTAITLASLLLALSALAAQPAGVADRILLNGEILTMEAGKPVAQALAIRGNRIVAVGTNTEIRKLRSARTEVIDLAGKTVVPGLIDTHIHAIRGGQGYGFETYWYDTASLADGIDELKAEAVKRGPGQWVAVVGSWHPEQFVEKRSPTSVELSQAMPNNPAFVQYLYDWAVVNERGIEALKLDAGAELPTGIRVERDERGKATGRIFGGVGPFSALFARISGRPEPDRRDSLKAFFAQLNRLGITAFIDPLAGDHVVFTPLFDLWQDKALTVRVAFRVSALRPGDETQWLQQSLAYLPPRFGDDMLRFLGVGEVLVYGMYDGVRMGPGFKPSQQARDELAKAATFAAQRRYSLELHAYTDDAANAILDVLEGVAQQYPIKNLRWTIAHISTGSDATFERMKKLGLAYSVQMGPYFEAPAIREANSDAAAQASPPTRLALRKGLMVAGGTDATRIGASVWHAIEYHVTGRSAGGVVQRRTDFLLSRDEALRLYTANAAWITSDEANRGTLAPGKLADLAVLDAPYLRVPADKIHTIRAALTMVDGKIVQSADRLASPPAQGRPRGSTQSARP